jgi:hypothetical protein
MKGIAEWRTDQKIGSVSLKDGYSIEISKNGDQVFIARNGEYVGDLHITNGRIGLFLPAAEDFESNKKVLA